MNVKYLSRVLAFMGIIAMSGCRTATNVIGQDVINKAEYYRLSEGMTMAQVQETIGASGHLQTASNAFENYE